jgi:pimeloyl-ACP methyl ester carboxylesterase
MKWVPRIVAVVSWISARLGARLAWFLWVHPFGRSSTRLPKNAKPFTVDVLDHSMAGFTMGEGDPVLLIHGWGGTATDMAPLAAAVADAGFLAIAHDLPGHGSDRGGGTDIFRMAATANAVAGLYGRPRAVIAHSFGAAVTFVAFQHGGPDRVVLVAPAVKGLWFVEVFKQHLGLSDRAYRRFIRRFEGFAGPHFLDVLAGNGDVPGADILILHDSADDRTPYAHSSEFVERRPATKLIEVPDSGHKGILRDGTTLAETVAFLADL